METKIVYAEELLSMGYNTVYLLRPSPNHYNVVMPHEIDTVEKDNYMGIKVKLEHNSSPIYFEPLEKVVILQD